MPFAVFRQHQRKLLVVFAILAMIGFVLSDTLNSWARSSGATDRDIQVAELFGKKIHLSDLGAVNEQRQTANRFMAYAGRDPNFFGGTTRSELIDALILEREADRLGIPKTSEFARKWIDLQTFGAMNAQLFEVILGRFENKISGEQLLTDIAGQVRILLARQEIAMPVVTPLDVFRNYRDQSERASFKTVPFLVNSFVDKVGEPTDTEVRELYEKYKDVLPSPNSPTPGFKIPRKIKVESLLIDSNAIAKQIREKLPEEELKSLYESRKTEFPLDRELPPDLFLGEPNLTPPQYVPFSEVRETLASSLAREKANEEVLDTFAKIREEFVDEFADKYQSVIDDINDAKKEGRSTEDYTLPKPEDLAGVAKKYNLVHEISPLLDRAEADQYGRISLARAGSGRSFDAKNFAAVAFDPKTSLYEGFELSDIVGDRYLARKIEDNPAHVAPLDEVRNEVVQAWKVEKARPLARKAAEEYAAKLKESGGQIKDLTVDGRPVISIASTTKYKPGMPIPSQFPGQSSFQRGPATLTELREIPNAGEPLVDTLFGLKPGEVVVQPDQPETTYYAMTLEKRDPVSFESLMGPNGSMASYWSETQYEIMRKSYSEGMTRLREQAGYKPEDFPTEERTDSEG
ncbi:hypothetical protein P12x_001332 [Tundrisphaera lichenicola]|uniref:hypothetical protein n=1 Tax=Tundrisphaera lichenicola TaxID=2029860 RepID=UPI003EBA018F